MTPMDAISLVLVKTEPLPVTSWPATHLPPTVPPAVPPCRSATGIGYASKQLSLMAGKLANYSPNRW